MTHFIVLTTSLYMSTYLLIILKIVFIFCTLLNYEFISSYHVDNIQILMFHCASHRPDMGRGCPHAQEILR